MPQNHSRRHDANIILQVDIHGLTINISPHDSGNPAPGNTEPTSTTKSKAKGKSKAKSEGIEIISSADLRLKGGYHYGLVGRNGTGKSSISISTYFYIFEKTLMFLPAILRAMADKLIPGISYSTRISILQQTDAEEEDNSAPAAQLSSDQKTVLQHVMGSNESRNRIVRNTNSE